MNFFSAARKDKRGCHEKADNLLSRRVVFTYQTFCRRPPELAKVKTDSLQWLKSLALVRFCVCYQFYGTFRIPQVNNVHEMFCTRHSTCVSEGSGSVWAKGLTFRNSFTPRIKFV